MDADRSWPDHRIDRATLVAIAVVAYGLANVIHECLGHGGTCVAVGARLQVLSAVHAECDVQSSGWLAGALVMAAGTVANLLAGGAAWIVLRQQRGQPTRLRYFLWLFMTVNLLQATGYWLFSGVGNIGDWAGIIAGLELQWAYRVVLAAAGAVGYSAAIHLALRTLNPMLGDAPDRFERAQTLCLLPYLAGGILYVAAGALNPVSPRLVLISAAAASLGGTSALAWMTKRLRRPRYHPEGESVLSINRSVVWIAAAAAVALVFVVVLGPGIRF